MSEAHGDGPVVEVEVHAGPEGAGGSGEGGEVVEAAAVEPLAEAAVQVAQIEADRDVEIARIEADTSIEHHELGVKETEAFAEQLSTSELEQCRVRIAELEAENHALKNPPPVAVAVAVPLTSTELEAPQSPPEVEALQSESTAEDGPKESHAETAAEEPAKPKRRPHRWI